MKQPNIFAVSKDGKKYVKMESLMNMMIACCDGVSLTFFGNEKTPYIGIDTAISWCNKEKEHDKKTDFKMIIGVLEKFKAQEIAA